MRAAVVSPRRLLFLPLDVGVGVAVERILFLRADLGEVLFSDLSCEFAGGSSVDDRMDSLFWVLFLGVAAAFSFVGLGVELRFSGLVGEGGRGAESKEPTADALFPRIPCSIPKFGVRSLIWKGGEGGLKIWGDAPWPEKIWRQLLPGKKVNSSAEDLVVISVLLRVLSARKECTVLSF
uniref:Uncharacterized protein n=1 Tax=Setaria viridis TaxID=4556 RepID=A0A4U6WF94_SETVI|nr:hypothetical protein SEVIR_1G306600v2 [Setaria viridis]